MKNLKQPTESPFRRFFSDPFGLQAKVAEAERQNKLWEDSCAQLILRHMEANKMLKKGWSFRFDSNLKGYIFKEESAVKGETTAMAVCNYQAKELVFDLDYFRHGQRDLEQTVLHEIAHYYTKREGHSDVWLAKARSLGYTNEWSEAERIDGEKSQKELKSYKQRQRKAQYKSGFAVAILAVLFGLTFK